MKSMGKRPFCNAFTGCGRKRFYQIQKFEEKQNDPNDQNDLKIKGKDWFQLLLEASRSFDALDNKVK